jgi:hypothetical protein
MGGGPSNRQAQEQGWQVPAGEKGTTIFYTTLDTALGPGQMRRAFDPNIAVTGFGYLRRPEHPVERRCGSWYTLKVGSPQQDIDYGSRKSDRQTTAE